MCAYSPCTNTCRHVSVICSVNTKHRTGNEFQLNNNEATRERFFFCNLYTHTWRDDRAPTTEDRRRQRNTFLLAQANPVRLLLFFLALNYYILAKRAFPLSDFMQPEQTNTHTELEKSMFHSVDMHYGDKTREKKWHRRWVCKLYCMGVEH